MSDFLYKCLRKNKHQRIKTEEMRSHPVFKLIEQKYNTLLGKVQLKHKDSK
jgi:serine/threonine protein kinase